MITNLFNKNKINVFTKINKIIFLPQFFIYSFKKTITKHSPFNKISSFIKLAQVPYSCSFNFKHSKILFKPEQNCTSLASNRFLKNKTGLLTSRSLSLSLRYSFFIAYLFYWTFKLEKK